MRRQAVEDDPHSFEDVDCSQQMKVFLRAEYERERDLHTNLRKEQVAASVLHRYRTYLANSIPPAGSFSLIPGLLRHKEKVLTRFISDIEVSHISNFEKMKTARLAPRNKRKSKASTGGKTATRNVRAVAKMRPHSECLTVTPVRSAALPTRRRIRLVQEKQRGKERNSNLKAAPRRLLSKINEVQKQTGKESTKRSPTSLKMSLLKSVTPTQLEAGPSEPCRTPEMSPTVVSSIRAKSMKKPRKSRILSPPESRNALDITGLCRKVSFQDVVGVFGESNEEGGAEVSSRMKRKRKLTDHLSK